MRSWLERSSRWLTRATEEGLASLGANEARYNVACGRTVFNRVPWTLTRVVRHHHVRGVYAVRI
jgi:hypothetical protein